MQKKITDTETKKVVYDDEVSFNELLRLLYKWTQVCIHNYKWIVAVTLFVVGFGLFYAYTTPKEYESVNKIVSYSGQQGIQIPGGLSNLANLAGVNLAQDGRGGRVVSESMFPDLLETYPVVLRLASEPLRFYHFDEEMSALDYFRDIYSPPMLSMIQSYTIGLPGRLISMLDRSESVTLNQEMNENTGAGEEHDQNTNRAQERLPRGPLLQPNPSEVSALSHFSGRINVDSDEGVITIIATMPDPYAAADLARLATELLMQESVNFEVRKTREELIFIEEQFEIRRDRFELAQLALAEFEDRNKGSLSAIALIEQQRLQNQYALAFELYSFFSRQIEQTRIKLNEDTPLFTILDPATVPRSASSPIPSRIFVISLFAGFFLGVVIVMAREQYHKFKQEFTTE